MFDPDPKPVIIDGADSPLAHVTIGEAMSVILQITAKLTSPDAQALADGLVRLAATAAGLPIEWLDVLRREVARARAALSDAEASDAAQAAALAYMAAHATPLDDPRTEGKTQADEKIADEHNRIAAEHGLMSVWSVSGADDLDAPHPYPDATTLVYETISGDTDRGRVRGGDGGRFTAPITGPRWLDLRLAADAVIQQSGDLHHRFVEVFEPSALPTELLLDCAGLGSGKPLDSPSPVSMQNWVKRN